MNIHEQIKTVWWETEILLAISICNIFYFTGYFLVYVHMYAAHDTQRPICDGEFFPTFPIFYQHSSKFTCIRFFGSQKNRCRTSDVGCRKSESNTCKQPNINEKEGKSHYRKSAVGCRKSMYTWMWLTTSDGRFAMENFFPTFSIFCKHPSKFTCHPIFSVPERKNRCHKSGVVCRKSESDTCKQPNINEEGKNRCRKSVVQCRKPHTCVCTLSRIHVYVDKSGNFTCPFFFTRIRVRYCPYP